MQNPKPAIPSILTLTLILTLTMTGAWAASPFTFERYYNTTGGYMGLVTELSTLSCLEVVDGRIYAGDSDQNTLFILDLNDTVVDRLGRKGNGDLVVTPKGVSKDSQGIFIADAGRYGVIQYRGSAIYDRVGPILGDQHQPSALKVEGDSLWVLDIHPEGVMLYNLTSDLFVKRVLGPGIGTTGLSEPQDMLMEADRIYIADTGNDRVQIYDRQWNFIDTFGSGRGGVSLRRPTSLAFDGQRLYVADTTNDRIVVFGPDGYPIETLGGSGDGNYSFNRPQEVRLFNGSLYVMDTGNRRVMRYKIDWTSSQTDLSAKYALLEKESQTYQETMIAWLDELKVAREPYLLADRLAGIKAKMGSGQNLEASNQLKQAQAELEALRLPYTQKLRLEIQRRLDSARKVIADNDDLVLPKELKYRQGVILTQIEEAQKKLNAQDLGEAMRLVAPLEDDMRSLSTQFDGLRPKAPVPDGQAPEVDAEEATRTILKAQILLQETRLSDTLKRATVGQNAPDSESIQMLLTSARSLLEVGAMGDANASLIAARSRIDELEIGVEARAARVQEARTAIDAARKAADENQASLKAMGIDIAPARELLAEAESKLDGDPETARRLALNASSIITARSAQVKDRGGALGIGGLVLGAIIVLAIGVWLLMKERPGQKG